MAKSEGDKQGVAAARGPVGIDMFASLHFRNDARFEAIAKNIAAMRPGDVGYPVRILQQGLLDVGYKLPISTARYGSPDGIFGGETRSAVKKLQGKQDLRADGVVGTKTVGRFDTSFAAASGGFAPPPALPTSAPGSAGDPAAKLREIALGAIGPGSAIFKDDWEIEWRPSPRARTLRFRINGFIDYGLFMNTSISQGSIKFRFLKRNIPIAPVEYIPSNMMHRGARIEANTMLLLKDDVLSDSLSWKVMVIHELTHAVLDYRKASTNALFNEMIAYISGSLFAHRSGSRFVGSGASGAIIEQANHCALIVELNTKIPQRMLDDLAKNIKMHPAYIGIGKQRYRNNGID